MIVLHFENSKGIHKIRILLDSKVVIINSANNKIKIKISKIRHGLLLGEFKPCYKILNGLIYHERKTKDNELCSRFCDVKVGKYNILSISKRWVFLALSCLDPN